MELKCLSIWWYGNYLKENLLDYITKFPDKLLFYHHVSFIDSYVCCKENGVPENCLGICKPYENVKNMWRGKKGRRKKGCLQYMDIIKTCKSGGNGKY